MKDLEVVPPPAAWEAIADRLHDDKQYATVSFKMNNFEVSPPAQAWNNILLSLEETTKEKTPVINIRRSIYRVAAAVAIIGISIGGWVMLSKNNPKNDLAVTKAISNPVNPKVLTPVTTDNNKAAADNTVTTNKKQNNAEVTLQNNEASIRHNTTGNHYEQLADNNKSNSIKPAHINNLTAYNKTPVAITAPQLLDKDGNPIIDMGVLTTSNYLVVTGPNGQLTRISSKFASVIRYLNNDDPNDTEEYLDKVIKESGTWKKRFQEWRNKISQSSYIPSSANFLDIVEFKDLIQEKQ